MVGLAHVGDASFDYGIVTLELTDPQKWKAQVSVGILTRKVAKAVQDGVVTFPKEEAD